jgi:hypothetical protein
MTEWTIRLPWPHKNLSSNTHIHWSKRYMSVRAARFAAAMLTREAGAIGDILEFTYHPPDNRKRDAQNMPDMLKASIDGIADAMGRDDNDFRCVFPSIFSEKIKGGAVDVHIRSRVVNIPFCGEIG